MLAATVRLEDFGVDFDFVAVADARFVVDFDLSFIDLDELLPSDFTLFADLAELADFAVFFAIFPPAGEIHVTKITLTAWQHTIYAA